MPKTNFSLNIYEGWRKPFITAKEFVFFFPVRKLNDRENLHIIYKSQKIVSFYSYGKAIPFHIVLSSAFILVICLSTSL